MIVLCRGLLLFGSCTVEVNPDGLTVVNSQTVGGRTHCHSTCTAVFGPRGIE